MTRLRSRLDGGDREAGFTLVELLVASALFMALNVFTFTAVIANARSTTSVRQAGDVNEEARVVLNRMSRELREASSITSGANPGTATFTSTYATFDPAADSSLTFEVDFNGNGII
ncbi:MAG: PilW family protein [Mycobacteriales bacterium]